MKGIDCTWGWGCPSGKVTFMPYDQGTKYDSRGRLFSTPRIQVHILGFNFWCEFTEFIASYFLLLVTNNSCLTEIRK